MGLTRTIDDTVFSIYKEDRLLFTIKIVKIERHKYKFEYDIKNQHVELNEVFPTLLRVYDVDLILTIGYILLTPINGKWKVCFKFSQHVKVVPNG